MKKTNKELNIFLKRIMDKVESFACTNDKDEQFEIYENINEDIGQFIEDLNSNTEGELPITNIIQEAIAYNESLNMIQVVKELKTLLPQIKAEEEKSGS